MASIAHLCRTLASTSLNSSSSSRLAVPKGIFLRWNSCLVHTLTKHCMSAKNLNTATPSQRKPHLSTNIFSILNTTNPVTYSNSRGFQYYSFKDPLTPYIKRYIDRGPPAKKPKKYGPTEGRPFLKGVVLKTMIKKPKKPNSANRKCVRVRLSTGREATAYVPGIGHNLQEHHTVLLRGGRVQDLPGVKLKCVRGKFDLAHVKKVTS